MVSPMPSCRHYAHGGARRDHALCAHAGFGEAKVQRIVAAGGERAVDVDQILHAADLRAQNNLIGAKAKFLARDAAEFKRAHDHSFHRDFAGVLRLGEARNSRPSCG